MTHYYPILKSWNNGSFNLKLYNREVGWSLDGASLSVFQLQATVLLRDGRLSKFLMLYPSSTCCKSLIRGSTKRPVEPGLSFFIKIYIAPRNSRLKTLGHPWPHSQFAQITTTFFLPRGPTQEKQRLQPSQVPTNSEGLSIQNMGTVTWLQWCHKTKRPKLHLGDLKTLVENEKERAGSANKREVTGQLGVGWRKPTKQRKPRRDLLSQLQGSERQY